MSKYGKENIPTVHGGILWGDNVNKRFYLYGGEWTVGFAQAPYHLLSYDILYDKWDDFGQPSINPPPKIASYGAGVGVSETGVGYYYGGWISNSSMSGWTQPRTMSSSFYTYAYDTGTFTQAAAPDKNPRAEGAMVWIPAGDSLGLLIYMGGIVSPSGNGTGNGTVAPQPFDKVFVFDAKGNSWSTQTATGEIPQNRRQFCVDVAWAPDKSSFNIYLWGGLSVPPPYVNVTSFNDIYILTLPSFIWVKAYPDHHGNATLPPDYGHYSASCNMVKSMSQLFVIGGTYTDTDACDLAVDAWAQHNFWTGTSQNAGDNKTYWALYDPNVTSNVVPVDIYSAVGGTKDGNATLVSPKAGFDSGNKPLEDLLGRRPTIPPRSPTRHISSPTNSSTPTPTPTPTPPAPPTSSLSTGAIVGIAISGAVGALLLVLLVWILIRDFDECKKRVLCDGSKAPDLFELKDFWRFYKDQSIGRLGNHATATSLLARAKQFNAGYKRRTGSEIGEETVAEINHLSGSGVQNITKSKNNYKPADLDRNLKALWLRKDLGFVHPRILFQFHFILLGFCHSGARRNALLKPGVKYKDIQLVLRRTPKGDPEFFFKVDQRHVNRDPETTNHPQQPDIEGLSAFTGRRCHTASWDPSIDVEANESESSVLELVQSKFYPNFSPLPIAKASNYDYSEDEKHTFRWDDESYLATRKRFENHFNGMFRIFFKSSPEQKDLRHRFEARMKSLIYDESLRKKLIPSFDAGCRRIQPG
ncbi:telomere-associated RecQ helicase [Purpureocillium lavendulum]|uniref:Telomere-associated RecQ helicase n=1 Tax=Purpureocillium lavendulum TaxID=1247861 RepID=A0AB34FI78_9HYPO|nr:telomere-associated RecQ helicase [Purpureocillium lavendulum]